MYEANDVAGCNTKVGIRDEMYLYCDPYEDGLDHALADQRGISKVVTEDRDLIYLQIRMALVDVTAAVVRAVADVHQCPRSPRITDQEVPDSVVENLAMQGGISASLSTALLLWLARRRRAVPPMTQG